MRELPICIAKTRMRESLDGGRSAFPIPESKLQKLTKAQE
jgi:hypothetical protein